MAIYDNFILNVKQKLVQYKMEIELSTGDFTEKRIRYFIIESSHYGLVYTKGRRHRQVEHNSYI